MDQNKQSEQQARLRDIHIARISFIGVSIVTIGDGISTLAAGLALEALEHDFEQRSHRPPRDLNQFAMAKKNLDHYIHELIQFRKMIP
ncbi:translation initiation factor 2 [Paenibacillus sp. GCM10027627]|uniref:translation initiation factor 2 n=1 Tax=unclassified Paenibacillus TaxID=185978 RepID=UPI003643D245